MLSTAETRSRVRELQETFSAGAIEAEISSRNNRVLVLQKRCVRYSGMAHFDTLIRPTRLLIFCLIRWESAPPPTSGRRVGGHQTSSVWFSF